MLIKQVTLRRMVAGQVSLAFRRWKRPTVKAGGTLMTSMGQLRIESVDRVVEEALTEQDAEAAGFANLSALRAALLESGDGDTYRIALSYLGEDPRLALRDAVPEGDELAQLVGKLEKMEKRAASPWVFATLRMIAAHPSTGSAVLAELLGVDKAKLKPNVRKLKGLGLTESLKVGYRLSPRGEAVLAAVAA